MSLDFDIANIRDDFSILKNTYVSNNNKLVYLDSAATTQKPNLVIEAINNYYLKLNSNVHRSAHYLAAMATKYFEDTRLKAAKFINAKSADNIIFTSGATESINLVANCFGRAYLKAEDEIIITEMEHHANIVPWQILRDELGIKLQVIKLKDNGELDLDNLDKLFNNKTKLLCVTAMSNALGSINPIKKLIDIAHKNNAYVLIDGSQAVVHGKVDVSKLDCDFFVFSAHKLYGPTGVGVLYGKAELLDKMPPYKTGGEMIEKVTLEKTSFAEVPHKFEAGTPNISGVIGFGAALDYVNKFDWDIVNSYENDLLKYCTNKLLEIDKLRIIGCSKNKGPIISLIFDDIHANDIGTVLDENGVAVRVGYHCAMPAMAAMGVSSTLRVSFAVYNNKKDIDDFILALNKVLEIFR